MNIPRPIIPKEYGAWAVLFVPMLVAISMARTFSVEMLFLALSAFFFFMSYVPTQTILRHLLGQKQGEGKFTQSKFWAITYLKIGRAHV